MLVRIQVLFIFFEQNLYGYYNGAYTQEQPAHIECFYFIFYFGDGARVVGLRNVRGWRR